MHCRLAFARRAAASSFGGGRSRPGRGLTCVGATSRRFRGCSPQTVTAVPKFCKHGTKSKIRRSADKETRKRSNPARGLHRNKDDHHHDCDVDEPFPNESLPRNRSTAVPRHRFVLSVDRHILRKVDSEFLQAVEIAWAKCGNSSHYSQGERDSVMRSSALLTHGRA